MVYNKEKLNEEMSKTNILNLCKAMSEQPTPERLQQKLDIINLNYLEHWKFYQDILISLGVEHPKYQSLEKILNNIIDERKIIQQKNRQTPTRKKRYR